MMDLETVLRYLKCNKCGSYDLIVIASGQDVNVPKALYIECNNCRNQYPVVDGIVVTEPSLWQTEGGPVGGRKYSDTFKSYSDWWLKVNKGIGYKQDLGLLFKEQTGKDKDFLAGKSVLDAGCGGGRFLNYVSQAAGGKIIAFDLGYGLLLAREKNKNADNVAYVQGNLLNPPFRKGVFDFVYSFGVLHHTPDPRKAFANISSLIKDGGHLAVYLYHRPCLTFNDRGVIYALRQAYLYCYREPLRRLVQMLPHPLILLFSRIMYYRGPLFEFLGKHGILKPVAVFLRVLIPDAMWKPLESRDHNIIRNYDHYSTRYNYAHTHEEVISWYQESAFNNIQVRKLPVTMIAEKVSVVANPVSVEYCHPEPSLWGEYESVGIKKSQSSDSSFRKEKI